MRNMAPNTRRAFDHFALHANRSALHQLDWERFYQFVRTAYRYHSIIWEHDVKQALVEAGFGNDYAVHISDVYTHCWQILGHFSSPNEAAEWRKDVRKMIADNKKAAAL